MTEVHVVLPAGVDDPRRPSGGNVYDRRICNGLTALGWSVHEHSVAGDWPFADRSALDVLAATLASLPDRGLVLVDGLVAGAAAEAVVPEASRLRLVVLLHMPLGATSDVLGLRERAVLQAAAGVVATSHWTAGWLRAHGGPADHRVHVVEPGTDPAPVAAGSQSGGRLLCVGTVTHGKGHDVLLDALAATMDLSWDCVWVGSTDLDPGFVHRLGERAARSGFGDRLRLTGPLTGEELDSAYASSDLLVVASRAETYGMVVTEAVARGLPVVATDVGGVPQALGRSGDGTAPGLLVPPGDAGALAAALRRWLGDPALRERLRRAARERGPGLPGWDATARGIAGVLSDVAAAGNGRAATHGFGAGALRRARWRWARLLVGAGILAALVLRLGAEPFVEGLRLVTAPALAAAALVTMATTLCCAWRWRLVAGALGVEVPARVAFTTYYRSQFLNATLPGGVVGDVHRGVSHGRQVGALGGTLRSVGWERGFGLTVHLGATLVLLLVVPSPLRSPTLLVVMGAAAVMLGAVALTGVVWRRPLQVAGADLRAVLREPRTCAAILVTSLLAVAGHVVVFLLALSVTGIELAAGSVPLAFVVLTVSALPVSIAGWGPREGAAAWAFAGTGLAAADGVTASVVYGVMVLVATLPGALLLLLGRRGPARPLGDRLLQEATRG